MAIQVSVSEDGSISLPLSVRIRLGLAGSGTVFLEETEDGVVLRTAAQAMARARALAKRYTEGKGGSDEFLANRRAESGA